MRYLLGPAIFFVFFLNAIADELPPRWAPERVQAYYGSERLVESGPGWLFTSEDGRIVYSVHADRICVWDRETGRCSKSFGLSRGSTVDLSSELDVLPRTANPETNHSAAWVRSSKAIAICTERVGLRIIDPETRAVTNTGIKFLSAMRMDFSDDGARMLALSTTGKQVVYDVKTGKELWESKSENRQTGACALAPDGKTLALARSARAVEVIDLATKEIATVLALESAPERLTHLAYTADGEILSVAGPGQVSFFSVPKRELLAQLALPREGDSDISTLFSSDRRRAAIRIAPRRVAIVDMASFRITGSIESGSLQTSPLIFSRDSKTLLGGANHVAFRQWDVESLKEAAAPKGHAGLVSDAFLLADARRLISVGNNPDFCMWDVASSRMLKKGSLDELGTEPLAMLLVNDSLLVAIDTENRLAWFDLLTGRKLLVETGGVRPTSLAITADSKVIYTGGPAFESRAIDVQTGKVLWEDSGLRSGGHCAVSTVDGKGFIIGTRHGVVRCRDAMTGEDRWSIKAGIDRLTRIAITPNGDQVAVANASGELFVLSTRDGKLADRMTTGKGAVADLRFSPDGRLLAYVQNYTEPKTFRNLAVVIICELASRSEVARLTGHRGPISSVFFSPDGEDLFTVARAGYVLRSRWYPSPDAGVKELNEAGLAWTLLGDSDGGFAYGVISRLIRNPDIALQAFAKGIMREEEIQKPAILDLIADLESSRFAVRERASRQLSQLHWRAKAELEKVVSSSKSEESRTRASQLLKALGDVKSRRSEPNLKRERVCAVLEAIGTSEARDILQEQAKIWPEAKAVLERVTRLSLVESTDVRGSLSRRSQR